MLPLLFQSEKKKISETLTPVEIKIEHIGSTAVPGVAGKPVIDMAGALNNNNEIMFFHMHLMEVSSSY